MLILKPNTTLPDVSLTSHVCEITPSDGGRDNNRGKRKRKAKIWGKFQRKKRLHEKDNPQKCVLMNSQISGELSWSREWRDESRAVKTAFWRRRVVRLRHCRLHADIISSEHHARHTWIMAIWISLSTLNRSISKTADTDRRITQICEITQWKCETIVNLIKGGV